MTTKPLTLDKARGEAVKELLDIVKGTSLDDDGRRTAAAALLLDHWDNNVSNDQPVDPDERPEDETEDSASE